MDPSFRDDLAEAGPDFAESGSSSYSSQGGQHHGQGNLNQNQAGRDINTTYYGVPLSVRVVGDYVRYTAGDLSDWLTGCVQPPNYDELNVALQSRNVVVLIGEPGTGRAAAAFMAINLRFGAAGRISGRIAPANVDVDRLSAGCGYVLDATYASWAHNLDGADLGCLSEKLGDKQCAVIIIVGSGTLTDPNAKRYIERHEPPDRWAVALAHFGEEITQSGPDTLEAVSKQFTAARLPARPHMIARAARLYTSEHGRFALDAESLEAAARGCLIQPPEMSREDWIGCRSFLIAWAILDGLPAAKICQTSVEIADAIHRYERPDKYRREETDTPPGTNPAADGRHALARAPLRERFGRWFAYVAEVDGADLPDEDDNPVRRRLKFRTPEFGATLLRVLWRDYPVVRAPLMRWMGEHIQGEPLEVPARIALALGAFASQDFAFVKLHYLNEWIKDVHASMHSVVAIALSEASRIDPRLRSETAAMVTTWSEGSITRKSTAVRALGTEIGHVNPERALRTLREIGSTEYRDLGSAVTTSLTELFITGVRRPVVTALIEWAESDDTALRDLAARALRGIARRNEPGEPSMPAMLAYCRDSPDAIDAVADLWRAVLRGAGAENDHWRALRRWSRITPRPQALRDLITRLGETEPLRPRLRFKLGRFLQESTP